MATTDVSHSLQVRSYELDSYAHVNNGAYLAWFEDGRERFLREEGRDYSYFLRELKTWILVVNIQCDYLASALSGDSLEISTRLAKTGRTSIVFRQMARRTTDDTICARARVVMVFADEGGKSCEIPPEFHQDYSITDLGDSWSDAEGGQRA